MKITIRGLFDYIDGKNLLILLFSCFFAMSLFAVEMCLALFLQLFTISLGIVSKASIPSWLPSSYHQLSITTLVLFLLGIGLVRFVAYFCSDVGVVMIRERMQAKLRMLVTHNALYNHKKESVTGSEVNYFLAEILPFSSDFTYFGLYSVLYAILLGCLFCGMLFLFPRESILSMAGLGLVGVLVITLTKRSRNQSNHLPDIYKQFQKGVERVSRNHFFIRVSRSEEIERTGFVDHIQDYLQISVRTTILRSLSTNLAPLFGILLVAVIIIFGTKVFATPGMHLLSFLYLFIRFVQQVKLFNNYFGVSNNYWGRFIQSYEFFHSIPQEKREEALSAYRSSSLLSFRGKKSQELVDDLEVLFSSKQEHKAPAIEIQSLSFSYKNQENPVFSDFSLSVAAGELLGIVGESGSGKSTLIKLILGMEEPSSGSILIDGKSIQTKFEKELLQIGYVGPEPFLIHGSIRENLMYGCFSKKTEEDCKEALFMACLDEFVSGLEDGLDYLIQENGDGLSAGQKQRIALARAFLNQPELLILDEASSNLDEGTEENIRQTILQMRGKTTILMISHRKKFLKGADQVIDFDSKTS